MARRGIFVAATGQHVGKTTICLGMIAALKKRFPQLGFMKPVGQQHEKVEPNLLVDKDVVLFKEYFELSGHYKYMSPIIFPRGFTRSYLDGEISLESLKQKIEISYKKLAGESDFIIVEGTGHVGVGSIVHLNNASVAAFLGLDIVMIAKGGLGSAFDELALNKSLCDQYGVTICGVILNRVMEDKQEMINRYMSQALKQWKIPLIGSVPYNQFLNTPTMKDFEALFKSKLLSGEEFHYRHFPSIRLVATSLETYQERMFSNQLIVTPATREDIILTTMAQRKDPHSEPEHGLILTGRYPPRPSLISKLKAAAIPSLYAAYTSYDAMRMITSFTAKIQKEDITKVKKAIELVENSIDFSLII